MRSHPEVIRPMPSAGNARQLRRRTAMRRSGRILSLLVLITSLGLPGVQPAGAAAISYRAYFNSPAAGGLAATYPITGQLVNRINAAPVGADIHIAIYKVEGDETSLG